MSASLIWSHQSACLLLCQYWTVFFFFYCSSIVEKPSLYRDSVGTSTRPALQPWLLALLWGTWVLFTKQDHFNKELLVWVRNSTRIFHCLSSRYKTSIISVWWIHLPFLLDSKLRCHSAVILCPFTFMQEILDCKCLSYVV